MDLKYIILFQKYYSARKKSPAEYEEIKIIGIRPAISIIFHQLSEIYNFYKHSNLTIVKKNVIGNIVKHQV